MQLANRKHSIHYLKRCNKMIKKCQAPSEVPDIFLVAEQRNQMINKIVEEIGKLMGYSSLIPVDKSTRGVPKKEKSN